jgi:hypothetical protein
MRACLFAIPHSSVDVSSRLNKPKRGDSVKYIGHTDRDLHVKHGETYSVFGYYPCNPDKNGVLDKSMPRSNRDEISIRVDDPKDDFGGVISLAAKDFVPTFGKSNDDYLRELRAVLGPNAMIYSVPPIGLLGAKICPDDPEFFVLAGEEEALIRMAREKREELV